VGLKLARGRHTKSGSGGSNRTIVGLKLAMRLRVSL